MRRAGIEGAGRFKGLGEEDVEVDGVSVSRKDARSLRQRRRVSRESDEQEQEAGRLEGQSLCLGRVTRRNKESNNIRKAS